MTQAQDLPQPDDEDDANDDDALDPKRLIGLTLIAVAGLVVVAALVGSFFREPLQELSRSFVDQLGGPGIAVGYFTPDALTVPIPNDTFGWFGIEGGMSFAEVVMWGTLGSIVGGSVGYLIGIGLRKDTVHRAVHEGPRP